MLWDGMTERDNGAEPQDGRRLTIMRLRALLDAAPDLVHRYEAAKDVVRCFRRPAFYEVATRCNLFCEGCYYFSDSLVPVAEETSLAAWEEFFRAEAERGVTMAYFIGAEPALEQERLVAASACFPQGNIGTNGTIRIDPAVPYRIGLSAWADDDATDALLRGGSTFRKAIANYRGDPRAIVVYTFSRRNLGGARRVAETCRDNGLELTFNMYSPTSTYLSRLADWTGNDRRYFRFSRPQDSLIFDDEALAAVRREAQQLIEDFPDTVVYSQAYNDWVTQPGPLHRIDPATGTAPNCRSRIVSPLTYHRADLSRSNEKCCTPDVDCSQCRMYSSGWSSRFEPRADDLRNRVSFEDWLDMIETLGRIFIRQRPAASAAAE